MKIIWLLSFISNIVHFTVLTIFSNLRRYGVVELVGEAVGMEEGDSAARGGPTEVFLPRHLQGQAVR